MIYFTVTENENYSLVEFKIEGEITPEDLPKMNPPKVDTEKGVVLLGEGPMWLFGFLAQEYRSVTFIGCYDPRVGGCGRREPRTRRIWWGRFL
jgi:CRISPR-associated protein Csx3